MIQLTFSEPVAASGYSITARAANGEGAPLGATERSQDGRVVRAPVLEELTGAYLVDWRVLGTDGDTAIGEFGFAVGSGDIPEAAGTGQAGSVSLPKVAGAWLFFVGLALALGGAAANRFVWRPAARGHRREVVAPRPALRTGAALAFVGAAIGSLALLLERTGGGPGVPGALVDTRAGRALLLEAAAALLALILTSLRPSHLSGAFPLVVAGLVDGYRGHPAQTGKWWDPVAASLHLLVAALWIGALVQIVVVIRTWGRDSEAIGIGLRRYSRLALWLVGAVVVAGVVTALGIFSSPSEVLRTSYGQLLLVKTAVAAGAIALAAVGRYLLRKRRETRVGRIVRYEAAVLIGVLVLSSLLVHTAPPAGRALAAELPGVPPPVGPVLHLADLAGQLTVGLAASEGQLELRVYGPDTPQRTGRPSVDLVLRQSEGGTAVLYPRSCGDGCFVLPLQWPDGLSVLSITARVSGLIGGTSEFAIRWPPGPDQAGLLDRVVATMRDQAGLTLEEQVTSGPQATAPARTIELAGGSFVDSEPYAGGGVVDVLAIGDDGRSRELAFALPDAQLWFRVFVGPDLRITREVIVSRSHLITRTFSYPP